MCPQVCFKMLFLQSLCPHMALPDPGDHGKSISCHSLEYFRMQLDVFLFSVAQFIISMHSLVQFISFILKCQIFEKFVSTKVAFRVWYLFWSISGWRLLWLEAQRDTQCVCLCIVCVRESVWRNRWYFYTAGSDLAQGFCHTLSPSTTRFMVSDFTSLHRRKLQTV